SREAAARRIVAMAPAVAHGGSLADAEAGEDVAEQGIGIDPAGDAAQRIVRQSERLRGQFELTGIEPSPGISKLSLCLPQGLDMARPRGELAAAGVFPGDRPGQGGAQRGQSLAGPCRDPERTCNARLGRLRSGSEIGRASWRERGWR